MAEYQEALYCHRLYIVIRTIPFFIYHNLKVKKINLTGQVQIKCSENVELLLFSVTNLGRLMGIYPFSSYISSFFFFFFLTGAIINIKQSLGKINMNVYNMKYFCTNFHGFKTLGEMLSGILSSMKYSLISQTQV